MLFFFQEKDSLSLTRSNNDTKLKTEINILKPVAEQNAETLTANSPMINGCVIGLFRGNKNLDKVCRKAYPLLFISFCFVYWIYFMFNKYEYDSKSEENIKVTGKSFNAL